MNNISDYQFVELEGVKIAYRRHGTGRPVLMVHGFASYSYTWQPMIDCLPDEFCFYTMDMKGFGYSEMTCDDHLSPFDQSRLIAAFINHFSLSDLILCGHSMGGAACAIAMFDAELRKRVSRLVLVDSAGFFKEMPSIIDIVYPMKEKDPILHHLSEEIFVDMVLEEVYYDNSKITKETVAHYVELMKLDGAKECLVAAAKQVAIANVKSFHRKLATIDIPTLIMWGEDDRIIKVEDALYFKADIPDSELRIISHCGHSPQEECPDRAARRFMRFINRKPEIDPVATLLPSEGGTIITPSPAAGIGPNDYIQKLRMRRLFDYWSFGTVLFIILLKILQFLKKLGFKAEENGWRKASAVYFRNEHAKFCLACLRLNYLSHRSEKSVFNEHSARTILIKRLAEHLRNEPAYHWHLKWRRFMTKREKQGYTDVIEAEYDRRGNLLQLTPHFDRTNEDFPLLSVKLREEITQEIIDAYNRFSYLNDHKRIRMIVKKLKKNLRKSMFRSLRVGLEIELFVQRIFTGTFIHFETMPVSPEEVIVMRAKTPQFNRRRHIGGGLLNILCRFTADYKEADLWMQYHHAPVDGTPMQEALDNLSKEWGKCGEIIFPDFDSPAAKPEFSYFGNDIFRVRSFIDFSNLFKIRKEINEKYYVDMGGPSSIISLITWGLSRFDTFRDIKFVFPIDASDLTDLEAERSLSLVFIRPGWFHSGNPLEDFLRFQREFNQRLFATRLGKSESHEFLELMAMTHPALYSFAIKMMPKALGEIVGTLCFSIIRDAEIFIAPISALQKHGFIAIGSCKMKTESGQPVGAVSFCGDKKKVHSFLKSINEVIDDFYKFI
jgi:pimeloyl-ACP methyl ester carboxylesterase